MKPDVQIGGVELVKSVKSDPMEMLNAHVSNNVLNKRMKFVDQMDNGIGINVNLKEHLVSLGIHWKSIMLELLVRG